MNEKETKDKKSPVETDRAEDAESTLGLKAKGALELKPGQVIADRYTVIEELGRGGMGVVYKVNQFALSRLMALKTIDASDISDAIWRRFQQEAKATSLLDHQNLISVHDFGLLEDRHPYFVMDLVEGTTLAKRIETGAPLSVEEALPIMIQVCFGLAYAHDLGIVHRDIKPSNIMLCKTAIGTANSTVKIVDFGIAKLHANEGSESQGLTRTGEIFGSPLYMSPEQCLGLPVDHRSDIYAVGCVFFEALAGVPPFQGNSALATMMKHQSEDAPTLKEVTLGKEFPDQIEKLISRLLTKDPDQRYQSLKAVARDLSLLQQGMEAQSYTGIVEGIGKDSRTKMISLHYAVLAICAASLFTGVTAWIVKGNLDAIDYEKIVQGKETTRPHPYIEFKNENADEKEFTTLVTKDGVLCRRFEFPKHFGDYTNLNIPFSTKPAEGIIYVPANQEIKLKVADMSAVTSPKFCLRFKSDDLVALDVANNVEVTDTTFENIDHLTELRLLYAAGLDISDQVIEKLNRLSKLKALYIGKTAIRQTGLVNLKHLKDYSELGLNKLGPIDKVLKKLRGSTSLQFLYIDEDELTDDEMKDIATLPNLGSLNIEKNPKVTNAGLRNLLPLKNLVELRISDTGITPDAISDLKKFPKLEKLFVFPEVWNAKAIARAKVEIPRLQVCLDEIDWKKSTGRQKDFDVPVEDVEHFFAKPTVTGH